MAWDSHSNFAKGTLTNSPGTAGTSFILGTGEGALFSNNMPVTLVPDNTRPTKANSEIGYVTGVSTDTLTVTRTQQGSTNQNVQAGWLVLGTITKKALTDIEAAVDTHAALTAAHGATGAVVGTTNTQTLTNKTLTTPIVDFITNAAGKNILAIKGTGSTIVNYFEAWGGIASQGVGLIANGTDSNIDLALTPKGLGKVYLNNVEAVGISGAQTLSNKTLTAPKFDTAGYIADANGNELIKFPATVASAVNEVTISNTATGGWPTIEASGTDANIDLVLKAKGTGLPRVDLSGTTHAIATTTSAQTLTNKTLTSPVINTPTIGTDGAGITGSSSAPATPAANIGKIAMAGTTAVRPRFLNSSGTLETIQTSHASYNPYKFGVYRSATQNTSAGAFTKVNFEAEEFDTNSNFDNVTNFRYTAPVAGFYFFQWQVGTPITGAGTDVVAALYKNGVACKWGTEASTSMGSNGSTLVSAAATDYFEVFIYAPNTVAINVGAAKTYFSGFLVSTT